MLSRKTIQDIIGRALSTGADYAEVFMEKTRNYAMNMIDTRVDSISDSTLCGIGVRAYLGLKSVYASTSDLSYSGVMRCASDVAAAIADGDRKVGDICLVERLNANAHLIKNIPSSVSNSQKKDLLLKACTSAKSYDSAISQVLGTFLDVDRTIWIANSEGLYTSDRQIRTRMAINSVASGNGENQTGSCSPGRRMGMELFDMIDPADIGREASRMAMVNLRADYCSAGKMPVAIENGFGGVIFHESCGHSLEATQVAYGTSQFCGKLGQQIANPKLTAIDDATIPNAWGSFNIDDEGEPSQRKVLIENGVLKRYMIDKFNSRRMGMPSSGSGRRQNYTFCPTSRMSNTFIAPGDDEDEDIIASIENGLYAKSMGGGSVNPATGAFNFAIREAYMIRNGKICEPVRGASLIGTGSDVIRNIDMIGKHMLTGQGMCGSASGSVPTDVGQPLIRVSSITVGGRA